MTTIEHTPIKFWAEDDRPREKLELKGPQALSSSELIAIIIGSGSKTTSALNLSKQILNHCSNNLAELSKLNLQQLRSFKGIGKVKAINIAAALEIGRRRQNAEAIERKNISSSLHAFNILKSYMQDLGMEQSWCIYLNRSNNILAVELLSSGGITATVIDPRLLFKRALELKAVSIILSHNHPSGKLSPSAADLELTEKVKNAGKNLDIQLLDHLIVTDNGYYSFADDGKL